MCDIQGKLLINKNWSATQGVNSFILSGISNGSYVLTFNDGLNKSTAVIISQIETESKPDIRWESNSKEMSQNIQQLKSVKQTEEMITMQYNSGEALRLIAYLGESSASAQITPIASQIVEFSGFNSAESGIYLGIIGFNNDTYVKPLEGPRYVEHIPEYQSFVNDLEMDNNTLLYHSVNMALETFSIAELPSDLSNVSVITFTDGLDQGSWMLHIGEYANEEEMLNSIHNRIETQVVNGLNINAYTIGIMGDDITDETQFQTNLSQLSSNQDNIYPVDNMSQVISTFQDIAESLNQTNITQQQTINVTLPGKSPGTIIRLTLDGETNNANNSDLYIQGEYALNGTVFSLINLEYVGLTSSTGSQVTGVTSGLNVNFSFAGVQTNDENFISSSNINQWELGTGDVWQINSEFNPSEDIQTETHIFRSSAAIILVLDCSSSLGTMFTDVQQAANDFIQIILDEAGESPNIAALFTADNNSVYENETVNFTDQSTNEPTSWSWDFGDGNTSTEQNPSHSYTTAGTYNVSLTASNTNSSDTEIKNDYISVSIDMSPVADFSVSSETSFINEEISFTDLSTNNPTSWLWDFGDGNSSTLQTPTHTYINIGTYTVSLTVINAYGSDIETKSDCVNVTNEITFTDDRDGNVYHAIMIGSQLWMAENLKYLPSVVGSGTSSNTVPYYYVYGYDGTIVADAKATANYGIYGVLYNWSAAMAVSASSSANPSGIQGVCPTGWHLPSDAEWKQLEIYLDMSQEDANNTGWRGTDEGGKLKEIGTTHWNSPNAGATNETGFTALPGGALGSGSFSNIGNYGRWWSATQDYPDYALYRGISYNGSLVYRGDQNKWVGVSVRCIRD